MTAALFYGAILVVVCFAMAAEIWIKRTGRALRGKKTPPMEVF